MIEESDVFKAAESVFAAQPWIRGRAEPELRPMGFGETPQEPLSPPVDTLDHEAFNALDRALDEATVRAKEMLDAMRVRGDEIDVILAEVRRIRSETPSL